MFCLAAALVGQFGKPPPPPDPAKQFQQFRNSGMADTLEAASAQASRSDRIVIFFVHGAGRFERYLEMSIRALTATNAVLVVQRFAPETPDQKSLLILAPDTLVSLDKHLNDLGNRLSSAPTAEKFGTWLKDSQAKAASIEAQLKNSQANAARAAARGDAAGTVREYSRILSMGYKGYPEIDDARAKLASLADAEFAKAKILLAKPDTESQGTAVLDAAVRMFKGLPQALDAELEIAAYLILKNQIAAANDRIKTVLRQDSKAFETQIRKAQQLLADLIQRGIQAIRDALSEGNVESAKDKIGRIRKDYAGTEVAKHASEVLADLK